MAVSKGSSSPTRAHSGLGLPHMLMCLYWNFKKCSLEGRWGQKECQPGLQSCPSCLGDFM